MYFNGANLLHTFNSMVNGDIWMNQMSTDLVFLVVLTAAWILIAL